MSKTLDLNTFKAKYDVAVFDMDGVITSEQTYWDVASLTAYEFINTSSYFGKEEISADEMYSKLPQIRKEIMCSDKVISLCKNTGVNSNWDLAYVAIGMWLEFKNETDCISFLEKCPGLCELYESTAGFISEKSGYDIADCRRNSRVWNEIVNCFQEWYMGQDEYVKRYCKNPVLKNKPFMGLNEKPLLDIEKLKIFLAELKNSKIVLGIATGRDYFEISTPLKAWGIYDFFDENRIITYDYVKNGEAEMRKKGIDASFVKPSPYCFVKSVLGKDFPDEKIALGDYEINKKVIAAGDAGADIFAAKSAGFDFVAVLTGINGDAAREFFEKNNSDYINNSLLDIV